MSRRLGPDEWIDAALRTLANDGVQAVRVEALARTLGVTKGSFYWHFKDRPALLLATLDHWRRIATHAIIEEVEAAEASPQGRLRHLLSLCTSGRGDRIESQIRAWAMSSPEAQAVLGQVDAVRESYVAGLLQQHGLKASEARHRSRAMYLALIGEFTWVAHGGAPSKKAMWQSLLNQLLAPSPPRPLP